MQSALDKSTYQLELLKTLEPEQCCALIAKIVCGYSEPTGVAVLLWDPDFESFSEPHRYVFGSASDAMNQFIDEFTSDEPDWDTDANKCTVLDVDVAPELAPMLCYSVVQDGCPVGMILIGGDKSCRCEEITDNLSHYAIQIALANCWEVSELKKEVERLREQYEQLEFDLQEEKRLNSLNGVNNHANKKLEQSDKEKLVYEISNAVRSSLDIAEVLQTAVNKIGASFSLSRCQVLWPMPDSDEYSVYEYHDNDVAPVKSMFFTDEGETFMRLATSITAPHDFSNESDVEAFDQNFLKKFEFLSGMLVPLIYHDRNIGALFLQDCMMPREWSIDNTALIGSLADLITVAIEHANMHEEKKRQAITDGLTGIANRRHFNESLEKEFERARRYGNPLSLVIVDLDFLKKINDTYGHHVGDEAIKSIGVVLSKSCRAVDLAARYGGEEFCLLLPDTDTEDAVRLAERIRTKIAAMPVAGPGHISASIGVATYPGHGDGPDHLFEAADQALYAAKEGGRNRVVTAPCLPTK